MSMRERSRSVRVLSAASIKQVSVSGALIQMRAVLALVLVIIVFGSLSPVFLTWNNVVTMSQHVAVTAILAIGMTFVILTAGIDLSVGSIAGLTGMVAGYLIEQGLTVGTQVVFFNVPTIIVIVIVIGALIGVLNGLLITILRVPPFIATLGMLYMARGVALLISGGQTYMGLGGTSAHHNTGFEYLGTHRWLDIPVEVYIMAVLAAVGVFVARRTTFGRRVYAVGGNERAAVTAGMHVNRLKIAVYAISGGCAAVAGLIITSELQASQPTAATSYELNAIAAVVLGGTSLFGGRGSVARSVIGAFVIGFLTDGMVLVNVSSFWQTVTQGAVIVAAVALDQLVPTHTRGPRISETEPTPDSADSTAGASAEQPPDVPRSGPDGTAAFPTSHNSRSHGLAPSPVRHTHTKEN